MNVIGNKRVFLTVSGTLVVASIAAVLYFGLALGIDFAGGTLWQLRFSDNALAKDRLEQFLQSDLKLQDVAVTRGEKTGEYLIRSKTITETERRDYSERLTQTFGKSEELRFESISPAVGSELRSKAIIAFILVLLAISLYIAFAFRKVSRPVASWKYGLITLVTLFHDAVIPVGLFAVLGAFYGAEVDTDFIVAVLAVVGFSVHDTIVVFDRIRENLHAARTPEADFGKIVNGSVNETMMRSLNTSLTLVLVLIALLVLGSRELAYFILTILVGVVVGTYSSIFVASPLLTLWQKRRGHN